jgi:DhnA family fructose-bisphosphate aldolase class Ia
MVAMDENVRHFIEECAQDLVGLEVALFFQSNPRAFDTASGIALRTHRAVSDVEPALVRLSEQGYLEVLSRGDGRYQVFALSPRPEVWRVLCRVSDAYHENPQARKEIILMLVQRRLKERDAEATTSNTSGGRNDV